MHTRILRGLLGASLLCLGSVAPAITYDPVPFVNITTATTTLVKTGPGRLKGVIIGTPVAAATITIYDSLTATGTKISTITLAATPSPQRLDFEVSFSTGLTVVTSGLTNVTVTYN